MGNIIFLVILSAIALHSLYYTFMFLTREEGKSQHIRKHGRFSKYWNSSKWEAEPIHVSNGPYLNGWLRRESEFDIKESKSQLLRVLAKVYFRIFILLSVSIGALQFILLLLPGAWFAVAADFYTVMHGWKYHGYSKIILFAITAVAVVSMWFITMPIRTFFLGG